MTKKLAAAALITAVLIPLLFQGVMIQSVSVPEALAAPLEEEPNLPIGLRPEAEVGLDDFLISRMGE